MTNLNVFNGLVFVIKTKLQVLLVLGAAGGVGLSAVQIGKVCGAVVIAAARFLSRAPNF